MKYVKPVGIEYEKKNVLITKNIFLWIKFGLRTK